MNTLLFFVLAALLPVQPVEHCTTIGETYQEDTQWQFVLLDDKGEVYNTTNYKVDEIYDEGERLVYSIKFNSLNKKGKEDDKGNRNIIVAKDLYLVNLETAIPGYKSDKPINISLRCSPNPGDAVGDVRQVSTYTVDNLGQKSYISNKVNISEAKYTERETITTELGELDCIKLTYNLNLDLQDFSYIDWIDGSLRTVKREIYDKKGRLKYTGTMTSYTKPK